jgi:hypothetical protein
MKACGSISCSVISTQAPVVVQAGQVRRVRKSRFDLCQGSLQGMQALVVDHAPLLTCDASVRREW